MSAVLAEVPLWAWALHWLAGVVTLAEALNKLDRVRRLRECHSARECTTEALKVVAWGLLALGGAGAVAGPLLSPAPPSLEHVCVVVGFAVLIVRTRVKEG